MSAVRVPVVDDSALMRRLLPQLLAADPGIEVVGTAMDGLHALQKIRALARDVLSLDLDMPRLDGIATLRVLRDCAGPPAVILSSLAEPNADLALQALAAGAFDVVVMPQAVHAAQLNEVGADLVAKVRAAAAPRFLLRHYQQRRVAP